MSAVTSCPKCSQRVSLPHHVADKAAWVRCPLCKSEYALGDALEFQPPVLELIERPKDAPALDEGNIVTAPPRASSTTPLSSETESDIITFDDELLLDAATDEIPLENPADAGGARIGSAAELMSEDEFFKVVSGEATPGNRDAAGEADDWPDEDTLEPYEIEGTVAGADEDELRLATQDESVFEPAQSSAIETEVAEIGVIPRRRSRRTNPVIFFGGIVGGGVLGLAIGYAILMYGFSKDPLALGPMLPQFMVPQALRAPAERTVARDTSQSDQAADSFSKSKDPFPAFGDDQNATDADQNAKGVDDVNETAMPADTTNEIGKGDKGLPNTEPFPEPVIDPLVVPAAVDGAKDEEAGKRDPFEATPLAIGEGSKTDKSKAVDPLIDPDEPTKTATKESTAAGALNSLFPSGDAVTSAKTRTETENTTVETENDATKAAKSADSVASPKEANTDPLVDPFATKSVTTAEPEPTEAPDPPGPVSTKTYTSEELMAAIEAAQATTAAALDVPADASQEEKNRANLAYYTNLSRIAELWTFLDPKTDQQPRDKATKAAIDAITAATPTRTKLDELGKLAGYWLRSPRGNGIVLVGMVKESTKTGNLRETSIETLGKPVTVKVVSKPSPLLEVSDQPLVFIGTIVTDPAQNLRGYEGADGVVIWCGLVGRHPVDDPVPPVQRDGDARNDRSPEPAASDNTK